MSRGVEDDTIAGAVEPASLETLQEANQQLRLESAQLHAILDQGLFMARLELDGTLVHVNRSALEVPGFKREQVFQRLFWDCGWWNRAPDVQEWIKDAIRQAASGVPFRGDSLYFWADGSEHVVDFACIPIRDLGGKVILLVATGMDITERVNAERHRRALEEQRLRSDALAALDRAKTEFFSNVSHEFRTPLALVLGPLDSLLSSPGLSDDARMELERARRNGQRLLKLVNTLLDFSRIEAGRVEASFEPVDLAALTVDLASAFRSLAEKAGLKLVVDCSPLSEPIWVDREMYEKVVLNLLSNAFKFTFDGEVCVTLRLSEKRVELSVRDTGTGIAPEELPRLFERFHRVQGATGRSHEGSGIGLALVQELVKLHGGDVHVQSVLGGGTTFTVSLPLGNSHLPKEQVGAAGSLTSTALGAAPFVDEASQWVEVEARPAAAMVTEPRPLPMAGRILLADDNADMRQYVRQLLVAQGWEVESVGDGATALERALASVPDLVLTDVMMPKLDGFGLMRALRQDERTRLVPIILLSARAGGETQLKGLDAGADDYLVKPFIARELLARVRTHLNATRTRQEAARVAEAARATAEAERVRLQGLLSQVPAVVNFLRGPDLVFEFVHPDAVKAFGGREVLGKPLLEAFPEQRDMPSAQTIEHVYRTGEPTAGNEVPVKLDRTGTGTLEESFWNFIYLPVRNAAGEVEGVMTFDIEVTDQVVAREKAAALLEELKAADQRKDEFLAMLAHELRNPMAAISMALTMLERTGADPAKTTRHHEMARRQMGNLVRLVDDLLDVSRITRGKVDLRKEEVNLTTLVQSALTATRPVIEARRHELSVTLASGPFRMSADATRLEQVVVNLLTNAAKYTELGGSIFVRLSRETVKGASQAILSVRDTGRGIPKDMLDKVFDMFVQVSPSIDRSTGGLGLGLTLVKRLVEMHDGSVAAHSSGEGKGSEFVVRLPLSKDPEEQVEPRSDSRDGTAAPQKRRILLVEDSDDVRNTLTEFLQDLGHEVFAAANGLEGAAKLLEIRPDVALVDVGLPGIDGYEVARRVRSQPGGEKIFLVALTGYGGPDARVKAESAGFDLHLTKPVNINELPRVLARSR